MPDDSEHPSDSPVDTIVLASGLIAGLDHACAMEPNQPTRQDLASRIIADWLRARGHLRGGGGCDEGKRPDDLTTGNDD